MSENNEIDLDLQKRNLTSPEIIFYLLPVILFGLIVFVMNAYSPLSVGPIGILGAFTLIYLFSLSLVFVVLRFIYFFLDQIFASKVSQISKKKAYYLSSVVAFTPIFFLALNSIGQLQFGDIVLVLLLISLACFYIIRRSK